MNHRTFLMLLLCALPVPAFVGCEKNNPVEEAVEEVADEVKDAANEVKDEIDDATK